jgi:hypothetical protein
VNGTPPASAPHRGRSDGSRCGAPLPLAVEQRDRSTVRRQDAWLDVAISLLLFAGVVLYLTAFPRSLGEGDESYFLLESKRIVEGEVLYRDIFWFAMPAAHWTMALIFAAFGTSIDVARSAMAVVHGLTAIALFAVCRRLGVRREFALVPPIAHVGLCQPAWPFASPHWFSTFLMVLLLFAVLGRAWVRRATSAFLLGALTGALTAVYQQKGAAFAVAIGGLFVLEDFLRRSFRADGGGRTVRVRLLSYGAGIAIVVVPVLCALAASAGVSDLLDQLVIHPLTGYRAYNSTSWGGGVNIMVADLARSTVPTILKYAPLVLIIGAIRLGRNWIGRRDRETCSNLLALIVLCGAAALAVGYYPDFIHLAFIAPLFFVFWSETIEAALRTIAPRSVLWGPVAAAGLLAVLGVHLARNLVEARREYPFSYPTAFGRIAFRDDKEVPLLELVRAAIRDDPAHGLFVYPVFTALYLTTDGHNPTRQQFLIRGYNSARHFSDTLQRLDASRVAHVVTCDAMITSGDPIKSYVQEYYEPVGSGPGFLGRAVCTLYRRREVTAGRPDRWG